MKCRNFIVLFALVMFTGLSACSRGKLRVVVSRYQGDLILSERARMQRASSIAVASGSRLVDSIEQAIGIDKVLRRRLEQIEDPEFEERWIGHSREISIIKAHRMQLRHICQLAVSVFQDRLKVLSGELGSASEDPKAILIALRNLPQTKGVVLGQPANKEREGKAKINRESSESDVLYIPIPTMDESSRRVFEEIGIQQPDTLVQWGGEQALENGIQAMDLLLLLRRLIIPEEDSTKPEGDVSSLLTVAEQLHAIQRGIEEVCPEAVAVLKWKVRLKELNAIDERNRRLDSSDDDAASRWKSPYTLLEIKTNLDRAERIYRETYENELYASVDCENTFPLSKEQVGRRNDEKELIYERHFLHGFLEPLWTNLRQSYYHISGLANFQEKQNSNRRRPGDALHDEAVGELLVALGAAKCKQESELKELEAGELWHAVETRKQAVRDCEGVLRNQASRVSILEEEQKAAGGPCQAKESCHCHSGGGDDTAPCVDLRLAAARSDVTAAKINLVSKRQELVDEQNKPETAKMLDDWRKATSTQSALQKQIELVKSRDPLLTERNRQWGLVLEAQTAVLREYLATVTKVPKDAAVQAKADALLAELGRLYELESPFTNITTTGAYLGLENIRDIIAREDRPGLFLTDDWQPVTVAQARAGAKSGYVIMRDHVGNWQVKAASNDPTELIKAASNVSIAALNLALSSGNFGENLRSQFTEFATKYKDGEVGLEGLYGLLEVVTKEKKATLDTLAEKKTAYETESDATLKETAKKDYEEQLAKSEKTLGELAIVLDKLTTTLSAAEKPVPAE